MSKNKFNSSSGEPKQIISGSRMIIEKTENGLVINNHITVETLEIYGKVEFRELVDVLHCMIDKTLCPGFEGSGRIYHFDDKIVLSGEVMFLNGFHCNDVNFV